MPTVILQGAHLNSNSAAAIASEIGGTLVACGGYYKIAITDTLESEKLADLREQADFDINQLPEDFDPDQVRLLITDMDSTFINIECVDEIADFAGIKPQVAAITESAMRGEIDFETSLTRRVSLLAGLEADALESVYKERLRLNPGAETMLDGLRGRNIKTALVSGGFTFFTERLRKRYRLDFTLANQLEISDRRLTGNITGTIIGAEGKARLLSQLAQQLGISNRQIVAMGDGANDLNMMRLAGLSIAYHAKPAVQAEAHAVINHCGLDAVLGLLDIEQQ